MLMGLKLLKRCIVAIEMADRDGSFLTALVHDRGQQFPETPLNKTVMMSSKT